MFNELCNILDPGKPSFTPKKGKASVVMFVGLQGVFQLNMFSCFLFILYFNVQFMQMILGCKLTIQCILKMYAFGKQDVAFLTIIVCPFFSNKKCICAY